MDEFLKLEKGQEEIAALEAKLRADGELSEKDKRLLERRQDEESKRIYKEKHDKEKQGDKPDSSKPDSSNPDGSNPDKLDKIDERQKRQQARIFDGIKSGELTMSEFLALERSHERFAAVEQRYRQDGDLSEKELDDLITRLDKLSKRIYRQKHDDDRVNILHTIEDADA